MCTHASYTTRHTQRYTYVTALQSAIVRILKSNYFLNIIKKKKIYSTVIELAYLKVHSLFYVEYNFFIYSIFLRSFILLLFQGIIPITFSYFFIFL